MEVDFQHVLSLSFKFIAGMFFALLFLVSLIKTIRNPFKTINVKVPLYFLGLAVICISFVLMIDGGLPILAALLSDMGFIIVIVIFYCIQKRIINRVNRIPRKLRFRQRKNQGEKMFQEYQSVRLKKNILEKRLSIGTEGVVLIVYNEKNLPQAYEVEFFVRDGSSLALETLTSDFIEARK